METMRDDSGELVQALKDISTALKDFTKELKEVERYLDRMNDNLSSIKMNSTLMRF